MTYQLNEAEYSAYLVTASMATNINRIVSRSFRDIYNKRYELWPGLKTQAWLERFAKACKDFPYHFTMGDESTGATGYDPKSLGFAPGSTVQPPPESGFSYKSKGEIEAAPTPEPGVIEADPSDVMIPATQAIRFVNKTLEANQINMNGLEFTDLKAIAPLRPLAFLAVVLAHQFPNFMLHYFVQSLTAVAIKNGCYTTDTVRTLLGISRKSTNEVHNEIRPIIGKFVNETNDLIKLVFPGQASESVLGDDRDKIMQEWNEVTKLAKLFTITLAPR
jgi:hypothetical protein